MKNWTDGLVVKSTYSAHRGHTHIFMCLLVHICVQVHVCTCTHLCVSRCMCIYARVGKAEDNLRWHLHECALSASFETGSLSGLAFTS